MSSKRIGILTEFNYEDMELWYPYYRLKEEGHETFTIGPVKGNTYNSKHGYPCKAEYGIDEIKVSHRYAPWTLYVFPYMYMYIANGVTH